MHSSNNSHRVARLASIFICSLLCIAGATQVVAGDLFNMSAATTDGGPSLNQTAGSSSVLNLVQSAVDAQGDFASFNGRGYNASLQYAGVANAMTFSMNNSGTSATLQIPSTGFSKTFTGTSRDDLNSQITSFLKTDGQSEYAKFLKAMNEQSAVAVSDGNPNSSTAMMASEAFTDYAFGEGETRAEKASRADAVRTSFGVVADIGSFSSGGISGTSYSLPISAGFKLTDRVGIGVAVPLNYTEIEGAKIFSAGLTLALPVKIILPGDNQPWSWQLTPSGGAIASASEDMLAGGAIGQGGISSMLTYDFGKLSLTMGNFFGCFEGIPVALNGYTFNPDVSQQITKNGLKISVPIKQHWIVEAYGIHTKFLQSAAVDQYFTVGAEIGWRSSSQKSYWSIGFYSDIADNYTSTRAKIGTSWKF
jgi:hypothetical protein